MFKNKVVKYSIYTFGVIALLVFLTFSTYFVLTLAKPNISSLTGSDLFDPELRAEGLVKKFPRAYIVQSGSMAPAVKTGSIVIVSPIDNYSEGDVVSFTLHDNKKNVITHRIDFKLYPEGIDKEPVYMTSGDANEDFDTWQVKNSDIIGKVTVNLPYLGYLADYARKPYGFILFVIVPATIIIYEELRMLVGLLVTGVKSIRRKEKRSQVNLLHRNQRGVLKAAVVIPIFGAFLVFAALSSSFFFDKEDSVGNVFQAASSFGTPTPTPPTPTPPQIAQTLVINEVLPDSSCSQGQTEAQWLEIYNGFPNSVNLKNFKITDGTNVIDLVSAGNIDVPSGGLALLAHSESIWGANKCYQNNGVITANLGGQLNIDFGHLQLLDPAQGDAVIDDVRWNDGGGPNPDPALNQSLERDPDGKDTKFGGDFEPSDFTVRVTPQPGL
ncbi:signal peptidase I [Candidatus Woesebacteria bacterium RBG_16_40_11]|uniref:Signal peptidase I n=1 Tax=Candidatus Woesebacteria bacterium RIFCSPHIGHO2_01_FULL_40_22 TaxID=1802499 RepID=A0A1F7YGS3_9BACT|nr:MAG: signal peptidase I [Candidatus Woesebacteria bacterium RBG_16_40_11]OGM25808.1 MAG: signal peptidase I [Candidatus Woesebacteria bacterium RIFCSPHIGHO2_01_FULL_40_22]